MAKIIEMTGERYGRLKVIGFNGLNERGEATWECLCDCGGKKITTGYPLRTGNTQSCGCLHREAMSKRKKYNKFIEERDYIQVRLTNTSEPMICDKADWERLKNHCWFKAKNGYVATNITCNGEDAVIYFHHIVLDGKKGEVRDHINRNRLDNRRSNLRIVDATTSVLNRGLSKNNTSGVKGVYFYKRDGKWKAQIMKERKCYPLGTFNNKEDAIKARKEAEIKFYGKPISLDGVCI